MAGWTTHQGQAVLLPLANIDTDQLIPARFMSTPRSAGYGDYLLYDLRRDAGGALRPDFPLNGTPQASVLVTRRGFGSGSSREAAVYALIDAGIRAVIAPSFGDIFASNAVNNGLLPARVDAQTHATIEGALQAGAADISVSLQDKSLRMGDLVLPFQLDDAWALKLQNGWDDIDLTQHHKTDIDGFARQRHQTAPWAWPAAMD